jgi:hypothetical protein
MCSVKMNVKETDGLLLRMWYVQFLESLEVIVTL